jgi:hypothetical protein
MPTRRWLTLVLTAAACAACAAGPRAGVPQAGPESDAAATTSTMAASTAPNGPALAAQIRDWKLRAGDHFSASADALEQVSQASAAEDEAGVWSGCQRLHDANSIGLQDDLPTPDPRLTAELQKMIDDMNTATHACLRFVLGRKPVEADTYQDYLARAIEHLQRAKEILRALES